jgi:hypothetical protein
MPEVYKPQGLGSGGSTPQKPKVRAKDEDEKPKKEKEDDPNSVLNVLKRGFMPMSERADAELSIKRRQQQK